MSTNSIVSLITVLNSCVAICEEYAAKMLVMPTIPVGYSEALESSCAAVADFETAISNFALALHEHRENYDLHWKIAHLCVVNYYIVMSTFRLLIKCW